MSKDFVTFIADAITERIANDGSGDFILDIGEDKPGQFAYVSPEIGDIFLITIQQARLEPAA